MTAFHDKVRSGLTYFRLHTFPILSLSLCVILLLSCGTGSTARNTVEPTVISDEIQVVRLRIEKADMYSQTYSVKEVRLEDNTLVISIRLESSLGLYVIGQEMATLLELSLVDCEEYRLGSGSKNCQIKKTAPYTKVKVEVVRSNGDIVLYVVFSVGRESYFSGYDGTQIIDPYELADETYYNEKYVTLNKPTATPATASTQTAESADTSANSTDLHIIVNGGNLRTEPVVAPRTVVGQVCPGDKVAILNKQQVNGTLWYYVRLEEEATSCDPSRVYVGMTGWVSSLLVGSN